ncbi:DUF1176 domain-containing protein [Parasphingopyxis algicola]|uniref:DUF1176 domain-containing protein n=1 Tax=Parasphingopyxis algicola TaxID=2026624 RepID=UPI0015A3B941|nr:DUF1176 domain-containing protein [Parasphingopyxis algicola]QLC25536.1 DUF1176 domain-containing protein [Parasphingopyxis algicola]
MAFGLFTLVAAAMATPDPAIGQQRNFGDWAVGCDNGWACEAISLASEDWSIGDGISLTVRQSGGRNGYNRVGLRVFEDFETDRIALHIGGEQVAVAERSDGDELFHFDPDIAQRLLYRIAQSRTAELFDAAGGSLGRISLSGSRAALLYIEDRQGRAGTVSASAMVGDEPVSTIPEPPAIPTITAMPVAARLRETAAQLPEAEALALHNVHECDGGPDEPIRNDAFILSDAADLILISCSRGAYNFSDIAFVRRDGEVQPARFDHVFAWGEARGVPFLVNSHWNPENGTLGTYAKGRGIGDCGTAERFVWDGEMFRLIERREMNSCRGSAHWVTVYRANVEWMSP